MSKFDFPRLKVLVAHLVAKTWSRMPLATKKLLVAKCCVFSDENFCRQMQFHFWKLYIWRLNF
ncbi:hypothetical protein LOK49_LG12G00884 [Camellia lanceoleosa]|uniref:Uncharacterized protein n=1 Tax=Camellia lanceoleosa TaxID=1840588 RepID=A0ACC0FQZ1_9ERIC|nr:hypothetical protein LOK49_LG12G00884 [Camellia lanceoleosa]